MAKKKKRNPTPRAERKAGAAAREAQRQATLEKRRQERAAVARKTRRDKLLRRAGIIAGAVVIVAVAGFLLFRPGPEVEGVEKPSDEGRGHVDQVRYETPTPTSGAHISRPIACGSRDTPPDPGRVVHALEHGAVVIWYRSDQGKELREPLLQLMNEYDSHVIVSPNEEIEQPIVATAWNRLMRFTDPGDPVLEEFVSTYRKRGPESVDCDIDG